MVSHPGRVLVPCSSGGKGSRAERRGRAGRCWTVERLEGRSLLATLAGHLSAAVHSASAEVGSGSHRAAAGGTLVLRNIAYEDLGGRQEQLDVYVPGGTPPAAGWPVLMAIHGGGWRKYFKGDYGPQIAAMFTPKGIAVVAMNYQLSAPGASSWPANFEDVRNSVCWT